MNEMGETKYDARVLIGTSFVDWTPRKSNLLLHRLLILGNKPVTSAQ